MVDVAKVAEEDVGMDEEAYKAHKIMNPGQSPSPLAGTSNMRWLACQRHSMKSSKLGMANETIPNAHPITAKW
jgi:hypothetical protein